MQEITRKKSNSSRSYRLWSGLDALVQRFSHLRRYYLIIFGLGALIALIAIMLIIRFDNRIFGGEYMIGGFLLLGVISVLGFAAILFLEIVKRLRNTEKSGPTQRRLVTIFMLMAIIPTVIVAIFSTATINLGFEGWFSDRVRDVVDNSYSAAQAYSEEHHQQLKKDGQTIYSHLVVSVQEGQRIQGGNLDIGHIREFLSQSVNMASNIDTSFIIDGKGSLIARGPNSYKFDYIKPEDAELARIISGEIVIIEDWQNHQFRYLRPLDIGLNYYLYLTRPVDGNILSLLDETAETASFYQNLEKNRQRFVITFTLLYLGVALTVLLLAIWAAQYFAKRLTRPINQLVKAVGRISKGELDVRVPVSEDQDEFSMLSESFNEMTGEVHDKQQALKEASEASEAERLRFNSVLESVSSGVIGVDGKNRITFINPAALAILRIDRMDENSKLEDVAAEFVESVSVARGQSDPSLQNQISIFRGGQQENIFIRINRWEGAKHNLIISFDDVSDLVQAQRMAAWGDVARRIAHEIKNPLTPIRLSAERIKRRFVNELGDDQAKFDELTSIIIRQTDDLKRIVDEFSRFSRMPEPQRKNGNWIEALNRAIMLHETHEKVEISYKGIKNATGYFDPTLMGQAFTNLIKNAIESIETRMNREASPTGKIEVKTKKTKAEIRIEIIDNGLGLPNDKTRLFEPYFTNKDSGTGLGLPIVKKIIEDHGGQIQISDREGKIRGAKVEITLPISEANAK